MAGSIVDLVRSAIEANKTRLDWSLATEICERAESSYSEARAAVNELDAALKQGTPASIELCILISSTIVYNCNDDVKKLIISKPFLGKLVSIITSNSFSASTKTQCSEFIHRLSVEFGDKPDFRYVKTVQKELEDTDNAYKPPQTKPCASDEALRESEDLNLAIALSLSQENPKSVPLKPAPLFKAKVLHGFEPRDEEEMRLVEGEIVNVTDTTIYTKWWKGYIDDKEGFFPSNFVQVIDQDHKPENQTTSSILDRIHKLNCKLSIAKEQGDFLIIADADIRREFLEITSQKPILLSKLDTLSEQHNEMMSKLGTIDEFVDLCSKYFNV